MVGKLKTCQCSNCEINTFAQGEKNKFRLGKYQITKKMITILESPQDAYQKKIELFNFLKNLEIVVLEPSEEERINCLLLGKLYNEVAKQKMKEYKKLTAKEFSKVEQKYGKV